MITLLVVSPERPSNAGGVPGNTPSPLADLSACHPSVEVLCARGIEETLEKLGRNRRIDAVLLLAGDEAPRIAEAVFEENPACPPIFASLREPPIERVRRLSGSETVKLVELIVADLSK